MSHRDDVLRQAMALPAEDRAYVVTLLERSLTDADELWGEDTELSGGALTGSEFLAELQRRSAAYRAGTSTARPAKEVLADMKDRDASDQSS